MHPTQDYLNGAEKVINGVLQEVRPRLLQAFGNTTYTVKADHSVVTELDTLIEEKLRAALYSFDSSVGFGGEESGVDYSQKTFWIVDPVDGTEQLLRGLPGSSSHAVLIDDGRPVMSLIYGCIEDDRYRAVAGQGAWRNEVSLRVGGRSIDRAWIDVSSPFKTPYEQAVRDNLGSVATIVHSIQAARYVAEGKIEGYVVCNGHGGPWDYAPRTLLIQEAGGRVTNLEGGAYDYRSPNFIATNPVVFDAVLTAIKRATPLA